MKFSFKGFNRRVLSIFLSVIMVLSVCVVGITPAAAADVTEELAHVGASGSGNLIVNGATIKIDGTTIPSASNNVQLNFTESHLMVIEASKRAQYFLKWEITGGTEGVDYELINSNSRTSFISVKVLTDGIHLTLKPTFSTTPGTSEVTFAADSGGNIINGSDVVESFTDTIAMNGKVSITAFSLYGDFVSWSVTGGTEGLDFEFTTGSLTEAKIEIKLLTQGADITFTAMFSDGVYTVVFEDYDGTVLSTQTVMGGEAAIPPEAPVREGYIFAGWNKSYSSINSSTTITATYTEIPQYTLGLYSSHRLGGTVEGSGKYYEGTTVTVKAIPYDGYIFTGWETSTIGGDRVADMYAEETTVTLTMDTKITAYFEKIDDGGDDRSLIDLNDGTDPYVYAAKSQFRYGEPINIVASGGRWVGIYPASATTYNNTYSYYYYTDGFDGQAVDMRTLAINSKATADPSLVLGSYQAVLFGDDGYTNVLDKVTFDVIDEHHHAWSDWNKFSTDKKNYEYGESIMITGYTDRPELNPWFAVVKKGSPQPDEDNFSTNVLRYAYLAKEGSYDRRDMPFDLVANSEISKGVPLEPGEYDIWLFRTASYEYPRDCSSITVHSGDGTVTTEKDNYNWYEDISVTADYTKYVRGSGAWVGIYKMSEINGGAGGNPANGLGLKGWFDIHTRASYVVDVRAIEAGTTGDPFTIAESLKGEYGVYLFATSDYSQVVASCKFTLTNEADVAYCDGYYTVDNLTDGFANGHVALELDADSYGYIGQADMVLYWADADGVPLEGYAPLHKSFIDAPVVELDMYPYTLIPAGAKTLAAHINVYGDVSEEVYVINLPGGCTSYADLDDGVLSEFQMISDTHVVSDKVTHYADGSAKLDNIQSKNYSNKHFEAMLNDVADNSPSSSGIFIVGDVVNNGFKEEYDEIQPIYDGVEGTKGVELPPLYVTLGNHDCYVGTDISPYINFANSWGAGITQSVPYYSKEVNGFKYIFLAGDNPDYYGRNRNLNPDLENYVDAELSAAQLQWLDKQLADSKKNEPGEPVFVLLHQPVYQTVYGTFETDAGVVNYEELKAVLNKYDNVIYLSGHSHYELNTPDNIYGGDATRPVAVNTSSLNYPWTVYNRTDGGAAVYGVAEGFYVRVYEDKVVFLGRDFTKNLWVPSACYVIYNKDVQADETASMFTGETLSAGDYNLKNSLGRTLTFTSSDTSVATVDANGNIKALKEGVAKITVLAAATDTEVVARKEITVTVKDKPEAGDATTVDLVGIDGDWDKGINMVYTSNMDVVTTELTLSAGVHRFKIREDGTLFGNDGFIIDTTQTTSDTGWLMLTTAGEATLVATGGTYVFTYTISTDSLVVTYEKPESGIVHDDTGLLEKVMSGEPYVHSNKDVYNKGEAIYVTADRGGWVGLFPIDVPAPTDDQTRSIFWYTVTGGNEGKSVDIRRDNYQYNNCGGLGISSDLPVGDYALYLFEGDGYNLLKTDTFTVIDPENPEVLGKNYIKTDKSKYTYREEIYATADVTSAYEDTAWVGVYPAGSDYRTTPAKYMYLVKDHLGEKVNLKDTSEIHRGAMLPAGDYDVYLFGTQSFNKVLAQTSISMLPGSISTNKDTYSTFSAAGKTEEILIKAELYDIASVQVENYITSTLTNQGLVVHRAPGDNTALSTINNKNYYRFISYDGNGWAYIEYAAGKYGYVAFEYITPTENSDVIFNGYVKSETDLFAEYGCNTKIATLEVNTPISVITYDNAIVKVQAAGMIGYVERYKLNVSAYAHESNAPELERSSWVGIWPADQTPGETPSSAWYYHYYDPDNTIPAEFDQFCNMSVSLSDIAGGNGTYYGGTMANTLPYLPAGQYIACLFGDGDTSCTNEIDRTTFTVVDNDMTGAFHDGLYEVENLTDGFANGTVAIEIDEDSYGFIGIADTALYWADENGVPLADYNAIARQHVDKPVVIFDMYAHTFIPEGAACLMAYLSCERVDGTLAYRIDLPEGCKTFDDLDEGILSEFQLVSDLHITSSAVNKLPNGQGLINGPDHVLDNWHYQCLLYDVTAHSPESVGIFVNGDVANNGLKEEYAEVANLRAMIEDNETRPYPFPDLYVNLGNHDSYPGNIDAYVEYATSLGADVTTEKPYYSVMVNGYKYIFLAGDDSSYYGLHDVADHDSAKLSAAQLEWLDAELLDNERNNDGKPVFVMVHQAVPGIIAGSLEGQWGYGWGVVNHQELTDVLDEYNNVILLGGHSHWELDSYKNHNPGAIDLPVTVNTASVGYLWTDYEGYEEYYPGSQGFYVRVYEDKVVFLGREFYDHKWVPSACYVFYNEDVSVKEERTLLPLSETLSANDYVVSERGRTLSYKTSDPAVATVDAQGNITAVSEGIAYITVNAEATNTEVVTRAKLMVVVPKKTQETITYLYKDRNGRDKSYSVVHNFTIDEVLGFEGNDFTPYAPACKSGETWINAVLYNAPFIAIFTDDIIWEINSDTYDAQKFTLTATQADRLFTLTCQVGDRVEVIQKAYNELIEIDSRAFDRSLSEKGFWYQDVDNNGKYIDGTDLMLTYGPYVAYRVTGDMNINYQEVEGDYDFNITIDPAAYGRQITSDADGTNSADKVTVDYTINILTPFFYGENSSFVPSANIQADPTGQHVTVESLRNAGYEVEFGVLLEQVGSFEPGSAQYPTFEDALTAAKGKNYGVSTDSETLTKVIENYTKPVMSEAGTYCTVYDTSSYKLTNKNRFDFTIGFNNTLANQKKFYNVYSYVTITTPEDVTTTYISNVQTLNIYETGQS